MSINETDENSVVDNIINEMNSQDQQRPVQEQNIQPQIDPNNIPIVSQQKPKFNLSSSNNILSLVQNFKSSIIVAVLIILFSFPQINKFGKVILNVSVINNLKYSYVFPYLVNGLIGGVLYYYMSNLNI